MKQFRHIANPVIMILIIGTFLYLYFFYLKDAGSLKKRDVETERENAVRNIQPNDPGASAVAGFTMQEENPFNLPNPQNQSRQNPLTMQHENLFNQPGQMNRDPLPVRIQLQNTYGAQQATAGYGAAQQPFTVRDKVLQEGHWIGLEVIPITAAIAGANNIPADVSGVLVDEVTLLSAEAGLLAGDVITAVNGKTVMDLESFKNATKQVALSNQAAISVYRAGSHKNIVVSGNEELGFAQMEAAPMILASSRSPHGYYGPCDRCHAISPAAVNSNQLARDQGDSLAKVAPNIKKGTPPPHRNRGVCTKCHIAL